MGDLKISILREEIMPYVEKLSTLTTENFSSRMRELETLNRYIREHRNEEDLSTVIQLLSLKMEDQKLELLHSDEINKLTNGIREFELKVTSINIPIFKSPGARFKDLRDEAAQLENKIDSHSDNCYAIANLRQALNNIKLKIEYLDKDNDLQLGWLAGGSALSAASIGVAFVPGVGLPAAGVLTAVSYLGRLIHRLYVSHERKNQFSTEE